MARKNKAYPTKLGGTVPPNLADKPGIYNMTLHRMRLLATNIYTWDGLPDSVNEAFLERVLYDEGRVCLFERKDMDSKPLLGLPIVDTGRLDIYGEPMQWESYGIDFRQTCYNGDSVIVYNNKLRSPTLRISLYFAERLMNIEKAISVNVKQQKHPIILNTSRNGELTIKNFYKQVRDDEEAIIVYEDSDLDVANKVTALDMKVKEAYLNLHLLYNQVWNEYLTAIGINNANLDKRERLITDEVNSNSNEVGIYLDSGLFTRKLGAEKLNKMFEGKYNVSVKFTPEKAMAMGGDVDGSVYNQNTNDMRSL